MRRMILPPSAASLERRNLHYVKFHRLWHTTELLAELLFVFQPARVFIPIPR